MRELCVQRGFERLKIIKPDFTYKKWYFTKVLDKPDIENREFYTDSYKLITIDLFNANEINGTFHCDYNNMMWIEMLGALKRFTLEKYSNFESIIDFVSTSKQAKNLIKYGDYYLVGEGNHRFCLAKFLCINLHDIAITEYEFNDKYYTKYTELEKRNVLIKEKFENFWILKFNGCNVNINENLIMDFIKVYDEIQIKDTFFEKLYCKRENIVISSYSDLKTKMINKLITAHKKKKHHD
jgi:hypothetical protein